MRPAREFYLDYLGFAIELKQRFEPQAPLHMQLCRDGLRFNEYGGAIHG